MTSLTGARTPQATPKEQVMAMLRRLPDNVALEEIAYHVYAMEKLDLSEKASEEGRVLSHSELREQMPDRVTESPPPDSPSQ